MKTYCGLEYSLKIKNIIIDTIKTAKENPFINYFFIVDDPLFFEEAFFKYTDTLFNIQIIRYHDLLKKLLSLYHLHQYEELTKLEKILFIKDLIESSNNLFSTDNKMELIYDLVDIFDIFHLEQIESSPSDLPPASKEKIMTILNIYQLLIQAIPQFKCYQYEDILLDKINENLSNNNYIFITDKIFNPLRFQFIKKIAKFNHTTILINDHDDPRNLNNPFKKFHEINYNTDFNHSFLNHLNTYLFSLKSPKYSANSPLHSLIQTTPKAEIESVVLNIYQNIVDNNKYYHDFAIYYPNHKYLELLVETLNSFKIPHNIKETLIFKEMDACILWLKYCCSNDDKDLLDLLDSKMINGFTDYNYLDGIKKRYIETGYIENPFIDKYTISNCHKLTEFSNMMITFINNEIIYSQNQAALISFFKNLASEQIFTLRDFYNLVTKLKPILKEDKKIYNDHLYLLNYNQCYSGILDCSHIYLVGVNETIVPNQFKDTGILLDHDYRILNLPDLNYQIALNQNNILKVLNSNINFIAICFSNASIDGQPLLKSSLYNQLKEMFNFTKIDVNNDYLHHSLKSKLYLLGAKDVHYNSLNNMIDRYKQTNNQPANLTIPLFSSHLSSSKLETYNCCPYRYFNQYGLKIYPFKNPTFQTNEIGTIIHYVLEKTKTLFCDNNTANIDQIDKLIEKYIGKYINTNKLNARLNYGTNKFIITMIKQDLLNTIIVLINQMKVTDFKIIGNEVKIKRDYSNFKFSGIVDRVDQYDKYLKIIDYKSSNKDLDISLAIQGFNIQMLLYLDALTNQMNLEKGALLYFNTKKRILASSMKIIEAESANNFFKLYKMNGYVNEEIIEEIDNQIDKESAIIKAKFVKKDDCYKGNILSSYSFERLLAYVNKHIEELYQEIISGKISIDPKGSDDTTIHNKINPCTYCNYQSLCNYDVFYNEHKLVDHNNLEYLIKEDKNNGD